MSVVVRTDYETETVRLFASGAAARGWRVDVEPTTRFCCRVSAGGGRAFVIGADFGLNDSAARRVAQDKAFAAHFVGLDGIAVVETRVLESGGDARAVEGLGWPVVVKPCRAHGGLGVTLAQGIEELAGAFVAASAYDPVVVVQRLVRGREVRVMVLDGEHLASFEKTAAPGRLGANLAQGGVWRDVTESVEAGVVDVAVRATQTLGLAASGVDVMVEEGVPVVLEVNATPGMKALGAHRPAALDRLIERALDRLAGGWGSE